MTKVTAEGILSGDGECWCLLVDARTFIDLVGEEPGEWDEEPNAPLPMKYRVYPTTLFGGLARVPVRLKIEVEEIAKHDSKEWGE